MKLAQWRFAILEGLSHAESTHARGLGPLATRCCPPCVCVHQSLSIWSWDSSRLTLSESAPSFGYPRVSSAHLDDRSIVCIRGALDRKAVGYITFPPAPYRTYNVSASPECNCKSPRTYPSTAEAPRKIIHSERVPKIAHAAIIAARAEVRA